MKKRRTHTSQQKQRERKLNAILKKEGEHFRGSVIPADDQNFPMLDDDASLVIHSMQISNIDEAAALFTRIGEYQREFDEVLPVPRLIPIVVFIADKADFALNADDRALIQLGSAILKKHTPGNLPFILPTKAVPAAITDAEAVQTFAQEIVKGAFGKPDLQAHLNGMLDRLKRKAVKAAARYN